MSFTGFETNEADDRLAEAREAAIRQKLLLAVRRIPTQVFHQATPNSVPRLIVVDGCNVGRSSCGPGRENVNCLGLLMMVRFWIVRDFDVVIFIPVTYNNPQNQNVAHCGILPKLQTLGILGFTSARTTGTRRRTHMNYDDLYVLDFAERHGGAVLSGDYFEDILQNGAEYQGFREIIKHRRIGVRFHPFGEAFTRINGDHFYRCCPEIHSSGHDERGNGRLQSRLFSVPSDGEYDKAVRRRNMAWSRERKHQLLEGIDGIIYNLEQTMNAITIVIESHNMRPTPSPAVNQNLVYLNRLQVGHRFPNCRPMSPLEEQERMEVPRPTRSFSDVLVTGANAVPLTKSTTTNAYSRSQPSSTSTPQVSEEPRTGFSVPDAQISSRLLIGGLPASTIRIPTGQMGSFIPIELPNDPSLPSPSAPEDPIEPPSSEEEEDEEDDDEEAEEDEDVRQVASLWNSIVYETRQFGEMDLKNTTPAELADKWLNEEDGMVDIFQIIDETIVELDQSSLEDPIVAVGDQSSVEDPIVTVEHQTSLEDPNIIEIDQNSVEDSNIIEIPASPPPICGITPSVNDLIDLF